MSVTGVCGGAQGGGACVGAAAESYSLTWSRMAETLAGGVSTTSGSPILPAATSSLGEPVQFKSSIVSL